MSRHFYYLLLEYLLKICYPNLEVIVVTTGKRIQQARKEAKMTQEALGGLLGVSGAMIGQYENDLRNPKQETLQRIADKLDVDVNWLRNGQTLEQRDQNMKDYVAQRFKETDDWRKLPITEKIADITEQLNNNGQEKVLDYAVDMYNNPEYRKP